MLTKTISYENYDGEKRTKQFFFNLTRSELARMELVEKAGIEATIKKMINEDDRAKIVEFFEGLMMAAVGEKSADGEYFVKNDDVRARFKAHPAYDVLFMELISSDKAMSDFISAIIPHDLAEASKNNKRSLNDIMGYEVIPGGKDTEVTNSSSN